MSKSSSSSLILGANGSALSFILYLGILDDLSLLEMPFGSNIPRLKNDSKWLWMRVSPATRDLSFSGSYSSVKKSSCANLTLHTVTINYVRLPSDLFGSWQSSQFELFLLNLLVHSQSRAFKVESGSLLLLFLLENLDQVEGVVLFLLQNCYDGLLSLLSFDLSHLG